MIKVVILSLWRVSISFPSRGPVGVGGITSVGNGSPRTISLPESPPPPPDGGFSKLRGTSEPVFAGAI